jgi:hypothetical protein
MVDCVMKRKCRRCKLCYCFEINLYIWCRSGWNGVHSLGPPHGGVVCKINWGSGTCELFHCFEWRKWHLHMQATMQFESSAKFKYRIQGLQGESDVPTKSMTTTHDEQWGLVSRADIKGKKTTASPAKYTISPCNLYFDRYMPLAGDAAVSFVVETATERGDHGATENAYKTCIRAGGGWSYLWIERWICTDL